MDKQERSLTWKYFWRQKVVEILYFIATVAAIIFIPYLLGHSIGDNKSDMCGEGYHLGEEKCSRIVQWGEGFLYIILGGIILVLLILLLQEWFENNWKKANKRAKKELRKEKKEKKR